MKVNNIVITVEHTRIQGEPWIKIFFKFILWEYYVIKSEKSYIQVKHNCVSSYLLFRILDSVEWKIRGYKKQFSISKFGWDNGSYKVRKEKTEFLGKWLQHSGFNFFFFENQTIWPLNVSSVTIKITFFFSLNKMRTTKLFITVFSYISSLRGVGD